MTPPLRGGAKGLEASSRRGNTLSSLAAHPSSSVAALCLILISSCGARGWGSQGDQCDRRGGGRQVSQTLSPLSRGLGDPQEAAAGGDRQGSRQDRVPPRTPTGTFRPKPRPSAAQVDPVPLLRSPPTASWGARRPCLANSVRPKAKSMVHGVRSCDSLWRKENSQRGGQYTCSTSSRRVHMSLAMLAHAVEAWVANFSYSHLS